MKHIIKLLAVFSFAGLQLLLAQPSNEKDVQSLLLKGKFSEVVKTLEQKISDGMALTDKERLNLALAYQRLMKHNEAVKILIEESSKDSHNTDILLALGYSLKALGRLYPAAGVFKEVTEKDSTNIPARIELASFNIDFGKYDKAKTIYEYLLESDSTNVYYLSQYGYCLYKLKSFKEAEEKLKKAMKLDKNNPKSALWLAKIHYDKEEYSEAVDVIKAGLNSNSSDLPLNRLGAEVLFKMKKYYSAVTQYKAVIMLGDSTAASYQKLGLSLYSTVVNHDSSDTEEKNESLFEAIAALNRSLEDDENNPLTLTYIGFCYKEMENYEAAIEYFNQALTAMAPDYIDNVYTNLGACYELTGKLSEAIVAYSKSMEYGGEKVNLIFQLATVFDRYYADKSVALAHYKKFLKSEKEKQEQLVDYAEERIENLKEEIHFANGRK